MLLMVVVRRAEDMPDPAVLLVVNADGEVTPEALRAWSGPTGRSATS